MAISLGISKKCYFQSGLLVVFSMALFFVSPTFAGVLKIQTQTTVEVGGQRSEDRGRPTVVRHPSSVIRITVALANEGTATAHNLQVHLKLLGETLDSKITPQLDPGGSSTFVFEKNTEGVKTGRYPLTVFVDFHDSNQYPFSALSGMTFSVGPNVNPDLAVLGKNITMDKKETLSLNIKNIGAHEKRILATLILPRELSTPTPEINFRMGPRSQKDLNFEIRNFSALPGADYPVFCYFEYDLEDVHHTAVSTAIIKIVEPENLFRRYRWLWMVGAAVLIMAFLGLAISNRIRQKSRKTFGISNP
jgi:hypothetical protein